MAQRKGGGWSGAGPMARSEQAERKGASRGAGLQAERTAGSGCVQAAFGFCFAAGLGLTGFGLRSGLGQG